MQAVRDRRATRWEHHRRTRRAELTDAAIAAIRRHGAGVGMDDVAAAARTSKTAVYRHFADRNQLYVAVCERVAEVLLAQVRAAIDGAGLIFGFEAHVRPHLDSGALVRVLEDWCPPFAGYFLYYPSRRHQLPALAALAQTLRVASPGSASRARVRSVRSTHP